MCGKDRPYRVPLINVNATFALRFFSATTALNFMRTNVCSSAIWNVLDLFTSKDAHAIMVILPVKNIETTLTIKLQSQSKYLAHLIVFSPSHSRWASCSAVSRRQRT